MFSPRHGLEKANLVDLFNWSPQEFEHYTTGSALHRLGYERWMRNLAVALGNGVPDKTVKKALQARLGKISDMVDEHINWALHRLSTHPDSATRTPGC